MRAGDGALVLGGDIGGSNTRIVVADADGTEVGRGRAGGGNPVSNPGTAISALVAALEEALAGHDPGRVRAAVLGMAGGSALADPAVRAGYERAWTSVGLAWPPELASDLEIAFASAADEPAGRVLIAGTGAVAGRIENRRLVAVADGIGWLLGDEGSGLWLGRRAVRAAIREVREGRAGPLVEAVLAWAGVGAGSDAVDAARPLVHAVYATTRTGPPVALAALAPAVVAAEEAGDPVAVALCDDAAAALWRTLQEVGGRPGDREVVVLAGGLTRPGSPLGRRLARYCAQVPGLEVRTAGEEVLGAVRLALRRLGT